MKWTERVGAWRAGGQTAAEFARGRGFEASTLRYWASRLGRARKAPTVAPSGASPVRMVRVTRSASSEPLTVSVGVARIEVRAGFNRALLREVIDALGGAR
jgi:hypothetical protein